MNSNPVQQSRPLTLTTKKIRPHPPDGRTTRCTCSLRSS